MIKVVLDASLESLPDLMCRAVKSVPRASIIEMLPDQALVGHRTNFATRAETTRFSFHERPGGTTEVHVTGTNGLVLAIAGPVPDAVLESGKAVLDALLRESKTAS